MSIREDIAVNLVQTLQNIDLPVKVKYVTREPFDFEKLSNAQFPAILVQSADEDRNDDTVGGSLSNRMATINYQLVCYVKGSQLDWPHALYHPASIRPDLRRCLYGTF